MKVVKIGRPREVVDPVRVCVRISGAQYDRLDRQARELGTSVPAIIRDRLSALETGQPAQTVENQNIRTT